MKRILLVLLSTGVLAACTHTTATPAEEELGAAPMEETSGVTEDTELTQLPDTVEVDYEIELSNFAFSEEAIEGIPGGIVRVKVMNVEGTHDFVIDELDVQSSMLQEGDEEMIEIQIPENAEVGDTYEFYCSVGNHREMGMEGTLTVVEI